MKKKANWYAHSQFSSCTGENRVAALTPTVITQKIGWFRERSVLNCEKRKIIKITTTTQATIMMSFEFQCVMTASVENSSRGMTIRCSLLGDQKCKKEAFPDPTDLTRPAYHHSSANGTFTPLSRMKTRVRRAGHVQSSAAASSYLRE